MTLDVEVGKYYKHVCGCYLSNKIFLVLEYSKENLIKVLFLDSGFIETYTKSYIGMNNIEL